ncbi:MAG: cyclopropane-fatty-acyl-phospholipid synthase family protein [Ilumatobacter sp.]
MSALSTTDPEVVEAVGAQRLADWAHSTRSDPAPNNGEVDDVADAARAACSTIGEQMATLASELQQHLAASDIDISIDDRQRPRQRHEVRIEVDSFATAAAAAAALEPLGFEQWERWTGAASRSFAAHGTHLTVARTRAHSEVLRISWRTEPSTGRVRRLLRSLLRPTQGDWAMTSLPVRLWPLYSILRPVRLVLERTGRRDPHAAGLGPFLSTPESMIEALFDVVDLRADDVLLDLGCGDGRLAIAAATTRGCTSMGAELDADLAARARLAVESAAVTELVTIVEGDAREIDLSAVSVAFMFLPMDVVAEILDDTLDRLATGARLIIHEQTPLAASISRTPSSSTAIIADDAVTVAHVWTA